MSQRASSPPITVSSVSNPVRARELDETVCLSRFRTSSCSFSFPWSPFHDPPFPSANASFGQSSRPFPLSFSTESSDVGKMAFLVEPFVSPAFQKAGFQHLPHHPSLCYGQFGDVPLSQSPCLAAVEEGWLYAGDVDSCLQLDWDPLIGHQLVVEVEGVPSSLHSSC